MTRKEAAKILKVKQDISKNELKKVWRIVAKRKHPDLNPKTTIEEFSKLNEAYETLKNSQEWVKNFRTIEDDLLSDVFSTWREYENPKR
jgi:DnaJ-class molecular chaperone